VEQQLLGKSAGGNSLSDVPVPDVPLPEAHPDGLVGEEWTTPRFGEEMCVRVAIECLSCEFALL